MIVRHKVKHFAAWKKAFDGHANARRAAGLTNARIFRSADDRNETVILFDMDDIEKAKQFGMSPDLKSVMASAGVVDQPTMLFLETRKDVEINAQTLIDLAPVIGCKIALLPPES